MGEQGSSALRRAFAMQQLRLAQRTLRHESRQSILVLLTIVADTAFTITFYYGIKLLIDAAVAGQDPSRMVRIAVGLGAFYVATTAANVAREYLLTRIEVGIVTDLRMSMLAHLQHR